MSTTEINWLQDGEQATADVLNRPLKDMLTTFNGAMGNINSPLLDLPLQNSLAMNKGAGSVTFSRSTTATYVDRYGVLQYAGVDEPRFEKDGLLIEGSSTNKVIHSNDFSNAAWTNNGAVTSNNAVAPDGTTTADTIDFASIDTVFRQVNISQDTKYTVSLFVKQVGSDNAKLQGFANGGTTNKDGYVEYDFLTDTLTATGVYPLTNIKREILPNGWVRLSGTQSVTDDTSLRLSIDTVSGDGSIEVWGAQIEELPFASSYIPTTDSAVTRGGDTCSVTPYNNISIVSGYNSSLSVEVTLNAVRTDIKNQVATDFVDIEARIYGNEWSSGKFSFDYGAHTPFGDADTAGDTRTYTSSCDGTTASYYQDGVLKTTTTNLDRFTSLPTSIVLGNLVSGVAPLFGHIKNFRTYDKALTATEVALLGGK